MQLIEPSVSLITERDPLKKIELAGRTCYKSEDKITEISAQSFVERMIKAGHLAMVEHAIYWFTADLILFNGWDFTESSIYIKYHNIPFSNFTSRLMSDGSRLMFSNYIRFIFSANLRVLLENGLADYDFDNHKVIFNIPELDQVDYRDLVNLDDYEQLHHKYTTMRFITDRGVTHEIVRHRPFSFAQESTRYVKYNKNNMQFIKPASYDNWDPCIQGLFLNSCTEVETNYCKLMEKGLTAQQARAVLSNDIKTELVVTGNEKEWLHFFELRCAPSAHPDCQKVANMAKELYYKGENEI